MSDNFQSFVNMSGYMLRLKKEEGRGPSPFQWVKRWYTIEGPFMRWYSCASMKNYRGQIAFADITHVAPFENGLNGLPYSLIVLSRERNLIFRVASATDLTKWINAIDLQCACVRRSEKSLLAQARRTNEAGCRRGRSLAHRANDVLARLDRLKVSEEESEVSDRENDAFPRLDRLKVSGKDCEANNTEKRPSSTSTVGTQEFSSEGSPTGVANLFEIDDRPTLDDGVMIFPFED